MTPVQTNKSYRAAFRSTLANEDRNGELRAFHRGTLAESRFHVHLCRLRCLPRGSASSRSRSFSSSFVNGSSNVFGRSRLPERITVSFSSGSSFSDSSVEASLEEGMSRRKRFLNRIGARLKIDKKTSSKIIEG